jgi:hypothetical protein
MTLQTRDRRALTMLAVSAILGLVYQYWPASSGPAVVAPNGDPITLAERRLNKAREIAAALPAKQDVYKKVSTDLAAQEKGIIVADTAAQAQAQLIQIVKSLTAAENPPIEIRSTDIGPVREFGDAYGEASIGVQLDCRIDQLVNLLAAISARPEMIATSDLRVASANAKDKIVGVRVTISAVVPRKLVPARNGPAGQARFGGQPPCWY